MTTTSLTNRYPSPPPMPTPPTPIVPGTAGLTPATDAGGNKVLVGDPSLNPQFNYGGSAPAPVKTETALEKATREYYDGLTKTVDPTAIREQVRQNMQGQIDAQNALYDNLVSSDTKAGNALNDRVRGINVNSGLAGSDFATSNAVGQEEKNKAVIDADNRQRAAAISTILGNIDTRATEEIKTQKETADKNSLAYLGYLKDKQDKAQEDVKTIASSGVALEQLPKDKYDQLLSQSGLDKFTFEQVYNSARKAATKINYEYKMVGNKVVGYGLDPITNQIKTIETDVPFDTTSFEKPEVLSDGTMVFYPKNIDPNKPIQDQLKIYKSGVAPKSTTAPTTNKITISEAKASGLPLSVVGQSEADIVNSLSKSDIPQWFIDKSKTEGVAPTADTWNTYRQTVSGDFGLGGA